MPQFVDFDDVATVVKKRGGLVAASMGELRDLADSQRLGVHVRADISERITALGLSHSPEELPATHTTYVWIYDPESRYGQLVDSVLNPSPASKKLIRTLAGTGDAKIIDQIRELVALPEE